MEKERCIIFVDHANLYQILRKVYGRIDYVKLKEILSKGYHLVGTLIYMGLPYKVSKEQKKFYTYLKKAGYAIHFRPLSQAKNGKFFQKGIDTSLSQDLIGLAQGDYFDKAILVSGDADFTPAIIKLKELEK